MHTSSQIASPISGKRVTFLCINIFPESIVHFLKLPRSSDGTITFPCGLVDRAGMYYLRMVREENGPVLTRTPEIHTYWPRFKLTLPSDHQALTSEVSLEFSYEGGTEAVCSPTSEDAVYSNWI